MNKQVKPIKNKNKTATPGQVTIGFQMLKILKLTRKFIDVEMKELGISRTGWQVLFWMKILGSCSQKELLKNLDIDAGHLARVLEDFEQKDYIVRTPIEGNRRSLFIQMTKYGRKSLMPYVEATIEREGAILLNGINDKDKCRFIKLLNQLEANMQAVFEGVIVEN